MLVFVDFAIVLNAYFAFCIPLLRIISNLVEHYIGKTFRVFESKMSQENMRNFIVTFKANFSKWFCSRKRLSVCSLVEKQESFVRFDMLPNTF